MIVNRLLEIEEKYNCAELEEEKGKEDQEEHLSLMRSVCLR